MCNPEKILDASISIYIRMYISTRNKFQDASNEFATAFGSAT